MAFTIPHEADVPVGFEGQSDPDKVDYQIITDAIAGTGVVSGCLVTAQGTPDMTVAVASGVVISGGTKLTVTSGNATIGVADPSNARFDLVVATSAGAKAVRPGIAALQPVFPTLGAGDVVLAAVYVPAADTDIDPNQIVDKRVIVGMGGDVLIYRQEALIAGMTGNVFRLYRAGATDNTFEASVTGDTSGFERLQVQADGKLKWGSGAGPQDTFLSRSTAGMLLLAGANATLRVVRSADSGQDSIFSLSDASAANATGFEIRYSGTASTALRNWGAVPLQFLTANQERFRLQEANPTDGNTAMLVQSNHGGSLAVRQVAIGAADSGGAGFRMLRLAN